MQKQRDLIFGRTLIFPLKVKINRKKLKLLSPQAGKVRVDPWIYVLSLKRINGEFILYTPGHKNILGEEEGGGSEPTQK